MTCSLCGTALIGDEASYLEYDGLCADCARAENDEPFEDEEF